MLEVGTLAFTSPLMLIALATLPVLWWLLRVMPPAPRLVDFPPLRLILALKLQEETPSKTPLWLVILRLLIAALIIVALAHPLLNPAAKLSGSGPLVLVIDDGWGAARHWTERESAISSLLDRAEREERAVIVLTTAPVRSGEPIEASGLMRSTEARRALRAVKPKPWPADRQAALTAIERVRISGTAHAVWLSDGLDDAHARLLAERLQAFGNLQVLLDGPGELPRLIGAPLVEGSDFVVAVRRALPRGETQAWVRAIAEDGRVLAREPVRFVDGEKSARARLQLPGDLRNAVARVEIENEHSSGGVFLLDERWRRRPVGLVSGGSVDGAQPLLGPLFYIERGLGPYAELRRGTISELLSRELAVLALADIGKLSDGQVRDLGAFVERGGVLVRFAGPNLAQGPDSLVPVMLRLGGRSLGGALSWSQPARLQPFADPSPFVGLAIPEDVRVSQQVLAEPTVDLNAKTWARLADGTPLVTGEKRGKGYLVLVHTTANADWSNLPLSGLFIEMMRRLVGLAQGVVGDDGDTAFPPLEILDGFGQLQPPPSSAVAIAGRAFDAAKPTPETPPGYYGKESGRRALNLAVGANDLDGINDLPPGADRLRYGADPSIDLKPWILFAALILLLADLAIAFALRGLFALGPAAALRRSSIAGLIVSAMFAGLAFAPALAQGSAPSSAIVTDDRARTGPDGFALRATLEFRFAYVVSGDPAIDQASRAGMIGLGNVLRSRTSVEPAEPLGIDLETHELAFFPLIYWAVSPRHPEINDKTVAKLNEYLRTGGTILFDTREQGGLAIGGAGGGPAALRLRRILNFLDIPALIAVPSDHVLTKAFYLLSDFPGRWTGGTVWVERRGGRHNDGVSSVIIGGNDWAGAWAVDESGSHLFPAIPGGEAQRQLANRFGVNWVMYALTGNYKTDQVHVPAILERLSQ